MRATCSLCSIVAPRSLCRGFLGRCVVPSISLGITRCLRLTRGCGASRLHRACKWLQHSSRHAATVFTHITRCDALIAPLMLTLVLSASDSPLRADLRRDLCAADAAACQADQVGSRRARGGGAVNHKITPSRSSSFWVRDAVLGAGAGTFWLELVERNLRRDFVFAPSWFRAISLVG